MRILSLIKPDTRRTVFTDQAWAQLGDVVELVDPHDTAAAVDAAAGAEVILTSWGSPRVDREVVAAAKPAVLLHAAGSVKPVVSDALWQSGARVTSAVKPLGEGVAETALGLTIVGRKNIVATGAEVAAGGWSRDGVGEVNDIRVGVLGAGWVGRHYLKLMGNFEVERAVYDPYLSESDAAAMGAIKLDLDELLATSQVVSVHAPELPATRHMLNAETLALLQPGTVLVNTSRGSLIDEEALTARLEQGDLGPVFLDVFDPEPPAADHPLRTLAHATPHLAGLAGNGRLRIGRHIVAELERFRAGEPMLCEVTAADMDRVA